MTRKQDELEQESQQSEELQVAQDTAHFTVPVKDEGLGFDQEFAVMQVAALKGTDIHLLANLLSLYPEMRDQLLKAASPVFGNVGIQKALNIVETQARIESQQQSQDEGVAFTDGIMARTDEAAQHEPEAPVNVPEPAQAEQVEAVQEISAAEPEVLAAGLEVAPEARAEVITEATQQLGAEPVAEAIKLQSEDAQEHPQEAVAATEEIKVPETAEITQGRDAEQEETWETKARRYNERHPELVDLFVEAAGPSVVGEDGKVDPALIVAWQKENGVDVDGRIGPATLAKAREGGTKAPPVSLLPAHCAEDESAVDPSCGA